MNVQRQTQSSPNRPKAVRVTLKIYRNDKRPVFARWKRYSRNQFLCCHASKAISWLKGSKLYAARDYIQNLGPAAVWYPFNPLDKASSCKPSKPVPVADVKPTRDLGLPVATCTPDKAGHRIATPVAGLTSDLMDYKPKNQPLQQTLDFPNRPQGGVATCLRAVSVDAQLRSPYITSGRTQPVNTEEVTV